MQTYEETKSGEGEAGTGGIMKLINLHLLYHYSDFFSYFQNES
jgi:hypothetical protein